MDEETLSAAEAFLRRYEKASKFGAKYGHIPHTELKSLLEEITPIYESLSDPIEVNTRDELLEREMKWGFEEYVLWMTETLDSSGREPSLDDLIQRYRIPHQDIEDLRTWLDEHRTEALGAIDRLYETREIESYDVPISTNPQEPHLVWNIPSIRADIIAFTEERVSEYHKHLGDLISTRTEAGELLGAISVSPTSEQRSYFAPLTKRVVLGIPDICFMDAQGGLHINEQALIQIYGHEMGHALTHVHTESAVEDGTMPFFIKMGRTSVRTTMESTAQFYERRILEDLKDSPETQRALGIDSRFDEIYQEAKDTELFTQYRRMWHAYAVTVILDPSFGSEQESEMWMKKVELLKEVEVLPGYAKRYVDATLAQASREGSWKSIKADAIDQLQYRTQSADRALRTFEEHGISYEDSEGRSLIDKTFLTGYWSAKGFEDNARLVAEAHAKE